MMLEPVMEAIEIFWMERMLEEVGMVIAVTMEVIVFQEVVLDQELQQYLA